MLTTIALSAAVACATIDTSANAKQDEGYCVDGVQVSSEDLGDLTPFFRQATGKGASAGGLFTPMPSVVSSLLPDGSLLVVLHGSATHSLVAFEFESNKHPWHIQAVRLAYLLNLGNPWASSVEGVVAIDTDLPDSDLAAFIRLHGDDKHGVTAFFRCAPASFSCPPVPDDLYKWYVGRFHGHQVARPPPNPTVHRIALCATADRQHRRTDDS